MGGRHIPEQGPNDDGYDEEGYDESQRAEILEVTRDGPSDGTLITDLAPDLGDSDEEGEDELLMTSDEVGEEDEDAETDEDDQDEDELQEDFDKDELGDDDDLDDADKDALAP